VQPPPIGEEESEMHARSGSFDVSPEKLDDAIAAFEREQVPIYREQPGYEGFTMLVDRDSGKVHGLSFWKTEEDMRASEELSTQARQSFKDAAGAEGEIVPKVWEVPIDDLP
jgi:heme-degrading monooxygenase HmoA